MSRVIGVPHEVSLCAEQADDGLCLCGKCGRCGKQSEHLVLSGRGEATVYVCEKCAVNDAEAEDDAAWEEREAWAAYNERRAAHLACQLLLYGSW
jgi:hypothetical protein